MSTKDRELLELVAEFDSAPDDAKWEPPHPIFRMASDIDRLTNERDKLLAALIGIVSAFDYQQGDPVQLLRSRDVSLQQARAAIAKTAGN